MLFHNNNVKRKRKRITRAKLRRGINGSISILLCLIITPFLSLALGLVEYARYQEVIEITDEIYDLTGVSALSDYDKYIHNRFGLLATSQESGVGTAAKPLLKENSNILGKQISVNNTSITGKYALSNNDVLKKQIVDFSELTSTTAVILEDFKIEDLKNNLEKVSQFNDVMNTVNSMADAADSISNAVDALEGLQTSLTDLQNSIDSAKDKANTLSTDMADLFNKLGEKGIMLPESASADKIEEVITSFCSDYLDDFKNLYKKAKNLSNSFDDIKSKFGDVKSSFENFKTSVNNAKTALSNITTKNNADEDGTKSEAASKTLGDVLNKIEGLINGALSDIKDEAINTAKTALDKIINDTLKSTGLAGFTDRYADIVTGDYFSLPLSDMAKSDLTELLEIVKEAYDSQNPDNIRNGLINWCKDKFVPDIHIDINGMINNVKSVTEEAGNVLKSTVTDRVISLLTDLVNVVKKLFDLDVFYEPDFNAYVDIGNAASSPYNSFLNAIGDLFSAIDSFKSAMNDSGLFSKLINALGAIKDMFIAIGDLFEALFNIVGDNIRSILDFVGDIGSADVKSLYERLLISGYMEHNLPSRMDAYEYDSSGGSMRVKLQNSGLTGFDYDNIARPYESIGQITANSGFQGLWRTIENLKNHGGSDTMFKGAELEYIRAGTNSEIANQIIVFLDLYFLRLILDAPSVLVNEEVAGIAGMASIAAWVVYILYVIIEPFCDTVLLVNGEEVPLIRTNCWLTPSGITEFIHKLADATLGDEIKNYVNNYGSTEDGSGAAGDSGGTGIFDMNYQTHVLLLLLIFVQPDTQISRLADIINLEATEYYRQQGKAFNYGKTYTAVEIGADVTFNPFFDIGTLAGSSPINLTKKITQVMSY